MMGEVSPGRKDDRAGRIVGFAVTLFAHVAFVALLVFARGKERLDKVPKRDHVTAHLVEVPIKAGTDKGKVEDPSKVKKGPQTPPPREVENTRDVSERFRKRHRPEPRPRIDPETKIESLAAIEKLAEDELDEPSDVTNRGMMGTGEQNLEEGAAKGAGGDKNDGITDPCALTFKSDLNSYRGKVQAAVSGFKRPSFVSAHLAENLVTGVRVTFDSSGKIVSGKTTSSSGNPRFDNAAEDFIKNLGTLDAPPKCVMFDMKTGTFLKTRSFLVRMKGR